MTTKTCENCGFDCLAADVFCENCGYDFLTGSLPDPDADPGPAAEVDPAAEAAPDQTEAGESEEVTPAETSAESASPAKPLAPSVLADEAEGTGEANTESGIGSATRVPGIRVAVEVDRDYFGTVVSEGEVQFPDPPPPAQELELFGAEVHIGRASESRAIHPDLDLALMTDDQAVSSRHAVIRLNADGEGTIADVGSTNGTLVGDVDSDPLVEGVPVAFDVGDHAYLGAWTKLTRLA